MLKKQTLIDPTWFGRTFRITLLLVFFIELLSFFIHWLNQIFSLGNITFIVIALFLFCLTLYKFEYGIYAALIELFIGSQGHYFDLVLAGQLISIRMMIFAIILVIFIYHLFKQKEVRNITFSLAKNKYVLSLAAVCVWGFLSAFLNGNQLKNIINDFNAWFYFLYLFPFVYILREQKYSAKIWPILCAGITAVSIKSLFFLYIFSHKFNGLTNSLYDWGRDTRWGEFTFVSGGLFRIFSQAQIFALIGVFILIGYVFFKGRLDYQNKSNRFVGAIIILNLATIVLSLSRSYWVALVAAFGLSIMIAIFYYRYRLLDTAGLIARSTLFSVLSVFLLFIVLFLPIPQQTVLNPGSALSSRLDMQDKAGASRWNQLPHLFKAITKHPILGSGWGTTITYESRDPRITSATNPTGIYTTYAFEWGYLDIILKIGILGLTIYLIFIIWIMRQLFIITKNKKERFYNALIVGLFLGLIAVLVTHFFSPYLNHPLGIGYLIILVAVIAQHNYSSTVPTKS